MKPIRAAYVEVVSNVCPVCDRLYAATVHWFGEPTYYVEMEVLHETEPCVHHRPKFSIVDQDRVRAEPRFDPGKGWT